MICKPALHRYYRAVQTQMTSDPNEDPPPGRTENRLAEDSPPLHRSPASAPDPPARHPLQSFSLANFKAFGPVEQTVPLRPITLLFGPNSGGKSSVLHFLLWMKDVVEGKGLDAHHPAAGGAAVDLGGFKQVRHGIDPQTAVSFRLPLNVKDHDGRNRSLQCVSTFAACSPPTDYARRLRAIVAETYSNLRARNSREVLESKFGSLEYVVIRRAFDRLLEREHDKFSVERMLRDLQDSDNENEPLWSELREANCPKLHVLDRERFSGAFSGENHEVKLDSCGNGELTGTSIRFSLDEILAELQALAVAIFDSLKLPPRTVEESLPSLTRFELLEGSDAVFSAERDDANVLMTKDLDAGWLARFSGRRPNGRSPAGEESISHVARSLAFDDSNSWLPREPLFLDRSTESSPAQRMLNEMLIETPEFPGLLRLCQKAAESQFAALDYLGPLRAYPSRNLTVADLPDLTDPEGLHAWRLLYEREDIRTGLSDWLAHPSVGLGYEVVVDHRVALNQAGVHIAEELDREISSVKRNLRDSWELCEREGFDDRPDPLTDAYEFLEGWDHIKWIKNALDAAKTRTASHANGIVYLRDKRNGKPVTSRDIGVGVSQQIPVFVYAKAATGRLIAIEQPEIHIHPALQAELGDVFIESALNQGNTFLIETHSEHLILRLLRRIRETTEGELEAGKVPLRPSDVCVLFVEPGENGSRIIELPVTPDGDFSVPWPGGFFMERADELF
jgi:predicted ATPase